MPQFHNSNPGLLHLADIGTSSASAVHNGGISDAINDEVSVDQTNKTIKHDEHVVRLDDFYNFPQNYVKVPVTVAQNSKNFVIRIGGLFYLAKNKNNVHVQQGYFRK